MSRRGLIPVVLAVGFGVANGYVTFNPAFQDLQVGKLRQQEALEAANLGPSIIEIPISGKDGAESESAPATEAGSVGGNMTSERTENDDKSRSKAWWPFGRQSN